MYWALPESPCQIQFHDRPGQARSRSGSEGQPGGLARGHPGRVHQAREVSLDPGAGHLHQRDPEADPPEVKFRGRGHEDGLDARGAERLAGQAGALPQIGLEPLAEPGFAEQFAGQKTSQIGFPFGPVRYRSEFESAPDLSHIKRGGSEQRESAQSELFLSARGVRPLAN